MILYGHTSVDGIIQVYNIHILCDRKGMRLSEPSHNYTYIINNVRPRLVKYYILYIFKNVGFRRGASSPVDLYLYQSREMIISRFYARVAYPYYICSVREYPKGVWSQPCYKNIQGVRSVRFLSKRKQRRTI